MANYYIDPDVATSGSGSEASPYKSWANIPNVSSTGLVTGNNYYQKCGTIDTISSKILIKGANTINIDSYGTGNKPIIQQYSRIESAGSFTETSPGSNIWVFDSGISTWYPMFVLGLGELGDYSNPSWRERRNYLNTNPGSGRGPTTFITYGQWDANHWDGTTPENAKFWIYADENPVNKWGTIYYSSAQRPIFSVFNASHTITIKNIHGMYGHDLADVFGSTGTTYDVTVEDCVSEHSWFGYRLGNAGTVSSSQFLNCDSLASGSVGFRSHGNMGAGNKISGGNILKTGGSESIGAVYGAPTVSGTLIIENLNIDTVYENTYWLYEAYGLYTEHGASNITWRYNKVNNCPESAGIHINGGSSGIYYYGNIITNCHTGVSGSDAHPHETDVYYIYNNLFSNVKVGVSLTRPTSNGTMTTFFKNNIFISTGEVASTYMYIDADTDDISGSVDEDYNIYYGFDNIKIRTGGGTLQQVLGVNNINDDPDLDSNYVPLLGSPAISAGTNVGSLTDYYQQTFKNPPTIGALEYLIHYGQVRMNTTWTYDGDGDISYPTKVNLFIDLNESVANELEDARETSYALIGRLHWWYIQYTDLYKNIRPSTDQRFTGMEYGVTDSSYVTRGQVDSFLGVTDITTLTIPTDLQDADSEVIVSGTDTFGKFDTDPVSFSTSGSGNYLYPANFNATYFLDWSTTSIDLIKLNEGMDTEAKLGDRLMLIFANPGASDAITAEGRRMRGHNDKVEFGLDYEFAIYSLVFLGNGSTIGWHFKNVIIGPEVP